MKGILLAGGTGSRLWPITKVVSKQLLPVYDKPMIYYPLSTLMLAGVRQILIITTPQDKFAFQNLLGDGSQFGIQLEYEVQMNPDGLAQAFILGENFLDGDSCLMILGDNIFHGAGLGRELQSTLPLDGGHIFTYTVSDASQYGVLKLDSQGFPFSIEEKPINPSSNLAVTGLYFFDNSVSEVAKTIEISLRGELEITSVIDWYLKRKKLTTTHLSRGTAWLDTGTPQGLQDASTYMRVIEERTSLKIGCLEEIAYRAGWISKSQLGDQAIKFKQNEYGKYLQKIIADNDQ